MGCGRRKVSHDCPLSSVGQLQLAELSSPQESCEERGLVDVVEVVCLYTVSGLFAEQLRARVISNR